MIMGDQRYIRTIMMDLEKVSIMEELSGDRKEWRLRTSTTALLNAGKELEDDDF